MNQANTSQNQEPGDDHTALPLSQGMAEAKQSMPKGWEGCAIWAVSYDFAPAMGWVSLELQTH